LILLLFCLGTAHLHPNGWKLRFFAEAERPIRFHNVNCL